MTVKYRCGVGCEDWTKATCLPVWQLSFAHHAAFHTIQPFDGRLACPGTRDRKRAARTVSRARGNHADCIGAAGSAFDGRRIVRRAPLGLAIRGRPQCLERSTKNARCGVGSGNATADDPWHRPQSGLFTRQHQNRVRESACVDRRTRGRRSSGASGHLGLHRRLRYCQANDRVRRSTVQHRQRSIVVERRTRDHVHTNIWRPASDDNDETGARSPRMDGAAGKAWRCLFSVLGAGGTDGLCAGRGR